MNSSLLLIFLVGASILLVSQLTAAAAPFEPLAHPKNLAWRAPEGHREKRYGGWGGGYPGGYGGYPMYGGYGGGYPMYGGGSYGSSSWGSYSSSRSGGYSSFNSGFWGK